MLTTIKPKTKTLILYLCLPVAMFVFTVFVPLVTALVYSFFEWKGGPVKTLSLIHIYRDTIKNWLTTDENGLYILDQKQIEAYISELAAKYDTVGTERTFNTYDGREITVGGGNYGWQIDQKEEVKELTRLIKNEETQVREPVYSHKGLVRKTNDIGYTYIEIDLTAQRMVFYKDGTPIADAQIVSGNPFVPNCATPAGCYTTGEIKSGYTVNGEDYPSAVNYWIPFDENLGINDAPWRTAFGEQLYEFEGTHGSICAPADQMQIIYNNVEKNTPVVIYE